ncbi:uncharacterized protein LOC102722821 [Oryza brachyantha]|uniref:uncharacterized protein LOC102722821 n=1 Tax=Oryza brachyantha TaxID=4533 RepID=UPI001ADC7605|nr:uncharacterized protein LOC102722821 [Oryza brachyantha]
MVSPEIQKDIAHCFAEVIVNSIIEEIGGDVFCLMVDESADVSDKEQMAKWLLFYVLEYVEKYGLNDSKRSQARGLIDYLQDFDFVFHLHLMLIILGHANALSLCLQRKNRDILEAMLEVKSTKEKFQEIRDDGWESLWEKTYSFCDEHGTARLDMEEEYIERHKPRKKTNRTNYQHYRWDCVNPVLDLLLIEFNDRFSETNSNLLTCMAAFNPKDSFADFKLDSLMELAKLYPNDFSSFQMKDLAHELDIYIDNV